MKIAILTPFYEPSIGGMQETMRVFAVYMASQGCEVRVYTGRRARLDELELITLRKSKTLPRQETLSGVKVFRFTAGSIWAALYGFLYAVCFKILPAAAPHFYDSYQRALLRVGNIRLKIAEFKPDVILTAPCVDFLVKECIRMARSSGARSAVFAAMHLSDKHAEDQIRAIKRLKKVDAVITITDFETDYMVSRGIARDKVHLLGVGLDLERMQRVNEADADPRITEKLAGKDYVLYFGRKQKNKGIEELVKAFPLLRTRHPNAVLVLAGDDTEYFLQKMAGRLASEPNVHVFGRQDEATKRWLFSHARVFSMVSRVDSYGIVYLESWLCRRPVIGADNGQMRCVIRDKEDGFLVPPKDPQALAEKLSLFFDDPALANSMGESGYRRLLRQFGDNAIEKRLLEVFRRMVR